MIGSNAVDDPTRSSYLCANRSSITPCTPNSSTCNVSACWTSGRNRPNFERLEGGITNHNFLVRAGGRRFVARLCVEREILGIERRNEVVCQCAAMRRIAPRSSTTNPTPRQRRYRWTHVGPRRPPRPVARAETCATAPPSSRQLADSDGRDALFFALPDRPHLRPDRATSARLPADSDEMLADADHVARALDPFVPVLCHNDLLAANFLDDGTALWLVDWEYAGIGHPLFDLANLAANGQFTPRRA